MSQVPSRSGDHDGERPWPHPVQLRRLVGHATAESTVLDAYRAQRLHHAWLIGGPPGVGKASFAWQLARFLLARPDPTAPEVVAATDLALDPELPLLHRLAAGSHGDLVVLERQWNDKTKKLFSEIRVDDVRAALGMFQRASAAGGYRICIIDSAEDLNRSSANALLKLIEEPPPRSIFLIVAHRPGQVMPTLVSRCRRLMLQPLSPEEIVTAVGALGGVRAGHEPQRLTEAATRARGSVGEALRLLDSDAAELDGVVQATLSGLPDVDWRRVHRLADLIGMSDDLFAIVINAILDWLEGRVRDQAHAAPALANLKALADAFETVRGQSREATALNLDKRPVLLSVFAELGRAMRTA